MSHTRTRPVAASASMCATSHSPGMGSTLNSSSGATASQLAHVLARRDDEAQRRRLAADDLAERRARLPQGEIEGRALERPAAVVARGGHAGLAGEQRPAVEVLRERRHGVGARQLERLRRGQQVVVGRRVADVLAAPLVAAAAHHDRRRDALEAAATPSATCARRRRRRSARAAARCGQRFPWASCYAAPPGRAATRPEA